MAQHTIFVYGTLKRQHSNHSLLLHSIFLGTAHTVEKHSLYVSGIPFVAKYPKTSFIHGEVYIVNDQTLSQLDQLEGHPDWYRREEVKISVDNGQIVAAWLYFYPEKTGELLSSGCYELR